MSDKMIKYKKSAVEINKIFAGDEINLEVVLPKGKDPGDYEFGWTIDCGDFRDDESIIIGEDYDKRLLSLDFGTEKWILTNGLEGENVNIKVRAIPKALIEKKADSNQIDYQNVLLEFIKSNTKDDKKFKEGIIEAEFTVPGTERGFLRSDISNFKGSFDQKIDQLTDDFQTGITVRHQRTAARETDDVALWVVIRKSTDAIGFSNYQKFMDAALCGSDEDGNRLDSNGNEVYNRLRERRFLPFNNSDGYRLLKVATEAFLMVNSGVTLENINTSSLLEANGDFNEKDASDLQNRMGGSKINVGSIQTFWRKYLNVTNGSDNIFLPYMQLIRSKLKDETIKDRMFRFEDPSDIRGDNLEKCVGILHRKLESPFLFELIWSYWQEEGMLVQTMNAIARRFQNISNSNGKRDPLANLEIDPLRPLNNLLWGFVQDEQHRLSLIRRASEYDHHYGISLQGKAVRRLHTADSRSKFLEAFHHLLYLCSVFFKQDDDTTVIPDGFPILNALREVHLILSQGAHNQFGDLPSTARQEMLLQQWLLARPEFREFLPTRIMVAYPEPWMDRVDAMKSLQGWTDISVDQFNRLAIYGEKILLSVRFGAWSKLDQSAVSAANWARFWREEIQGYIHAYRAATGVDLSSMTSNKVDSVPPSIHLYNRYMERARR